MLIRVYLQEQLPVHRTFRYLGQTRIAFIRYYMRGKLALQAHVVLNSIGVNQHAMKDFVRPFRPGQLTSGVRSCIPPSLDAPMLKVDSFTGLVCKRIDARDTRSMSFSRRESPDAANAA